MNKAKTNLGFTLQYRLMWSDGTYVDLRKKMGLKFILVLPDDTTINITSISYDAVKNVVWVRIPAEHTATEGVYRGTLSVMTTDLQMVTTGICDIAELDDDAETTYKTVCLTLTPTVVDTPVNIGQGYSPKIVNSEWYVYSDTAHSYVATGYTIGVTMQMFEEAKDEFVLKDDAKALDYTSIGDATDNIKEIIIKKDNGEFVGKIDESGISFVNMNLCDANGGNKTTLTPIKRISSVTDGNNDDMFVLRTNSGQFVGKFGSFGCAFNKINLCDTNGNNLQPVTAEKKLNVLLIGNSYTQDSWSYVPFILKNYGINIHIGLLYKSGNYTEQENSDYSTVTSGYSFYEIDTENDVAWKNAVTSKTIQYWVKYATWDIIVFQQGSSKSIDLANYLPSATELIAKVQSDAKGNPLFGWNINHTRQTADQPQNVLNCVKKMYESQGINFISAYGTAIFNARTNETLAQLGDLTNFWQDSNGHLQEGLPCYIASCAVVESLFRRFYPKNSIIGDTLRPTDSWCTNKNIMGRHGSCVGVTDENCRLAQRYAISAVNSPFSINSMSNE